MAIWITPIEPVEGFTVGQRYKAKQHRLGYTVTADNGVSQFVPIECGSAWVVVKKDPRNCHKCGQNRIVRAGLCMGCLHPGPGRKECDCSAKHAYRRHDKGCASGREGKV